MLGGASAFVGIESQAYVGIKIITKTHGVLGVYISQKPVNMGSDAYKKDRREAEKITALLASVLIEILKFISPDRFGGE